MAKIAVYLNGEASRGESRYSADEFKKFFFRHELTVNSPKCIDDLNLQIQNDIEQGVEYIFSVGGDGTANTISQNLIGKNVKMMVLPAGTANDFAHEVGVSGNLRKISQIFNAQTTKLVDAINVNGRYMISNGGIGMASEVAKSVNDMRKKSPLFKKAMKTFGKETYSLVYAQHMLGRSFKTRRLFIESVDSPLMDGRIDSALVLVNNQAKIGGKFNVAPLTKNDDGKINVTIFLHKNKIDLMKCTLMMMAGHYPKNDPNLISFETDKLTINALDGKPLDFFGDGETFASSSILDISVAHKALEVCTYKGDDVFCSSYALDKIEMIQ